MSPILKARFFQSLGILGSLFLSVVARGELQTTLQVTAPNLTPGTSGSFTADSVTGPAGSTTSTLVNPYANVLQYQLSPGTGRFSSISGTRLGVQFDSFQLFQSFLTTNFFTMVSSSTNCPASANYTYLFVRYRSPDAPRLPTDLSLTGTVAGGALTYNSGASPVFQSTSSFNLAGPTHSATAYNFDSASFGACASGVLRTTVGNSIIPDPYARFFFGSNFGFMYTNGGNPLVAILVPSQNLTAGVMSALAKHTFSGLFTAYSSATSQIQDMVYAVPDSNGTTFTLRKVTNIADPTQYTTYGSLVCTTLNSPTTGFCRGTITLNGVSGSGNAVCQVGSTSTQDLLSCTFQYPSDNRVGGSLVATRSTTSLLSLSVPNTPPNIASAGSGTATVAITLQNLTGTQITGLSIPALLAEQLVPPMSLTGQFAGTGGTCTTVLNGYSSCTLNLTYDPTTSGLDLQTLRVAYNNQSTVLNATTAVTAAADLASIAISPNSSSFANGTTQQFTATATYTGGATQDISAYATWGSNTPAVATITSTGNATFVGNGSTTISAGLAGVTGSFSPTIYTSAPDPSSPSAVANGYTQIDLGWTSGGGGTTAFQIAYQTGSTAPSTCSNGTVISSGVVGNVVAYSVTGLTPATQYAFRICSVAGGAGSLSAGVTATATTGTPHYMFATANTYRGSLGSIYFADYICQSEAASAGLSGTWRAVIGDEAVASTAHISLSQSVYNLRPGVSGGPQLVSTAGAFWGAHTTAVTYNAAGGAPGSNNIWMGANTLGVIYAGRTCTSWSTSSSGVNGEYGLATSATATWMVSNQAACNALQSLYCINLQSSAAAPPDPTGFSTYTLGPTSASFLWNSGGGTTAAYKIAYQTGGTAPANCSSGTVISAATLGVNPNVYNVTGLSSNTTYSFRICALNSDQTAASTGQTVTLTTLTNGSSVTTDLSTRQVIFATSSAYNGNLGSIYFADYICQGEASSAGLSGVWKAVISDESVSAVSRISISGKVFNMRPFASGGLQEIAANSAAFWASSAVYSAAYNAGGTSPNSTITWTGSLATGAINAGNTCTSWTTSSSGVNGTYGTNSATGNIINTANTACNTTRTLYCTNQQTASAAPPDPSGFATYTLGPTAISFTWASGGSTTAAYKLVYTTGGTAPANCNSGTVIPASTLGLNPTSYTVSGLANSTTYSFRLCALNSDQSAMSSGTTVTAATLANGSSTQIDLTGKQVIFATSSTRNGSFGGLYFADFICQNEAVAAGLTGVWKSVIGDESTSAASRIAISGKVYNMRPLASGGIQELVPDSSAFWSSSAAYAVNYNAAGGSPGSANVWTGATAAGAVQTGITCTSWTTGSAATNGRVGTNTTVGNFQSAGNNACNTNLALYCTNQQTAASAPADPSSFATYTLGPSSISFTWVSGGGTTAGYKLAYQTGGTAPANCSSGTVIAASTLGVNPTSYTVTGLSSSQAYSFRLCAVNSDQSSVSAGVTVSTSTLSPGSSTQIDLTNRQVVFATTNPYNGAFGGLYYGDWICQKEAETASLTGIWKAILSDESTSATSRISIPGKVYNNRPLASGGIQEIAADSTTFWGSAMAYSVAYNANGTSPNSTITWTGTTAAGALSAGNTCLGWTTSENTDSGIYGTNTNTGNIFNSATTTCNTTRTLYCTNQQSAAAAPPDPADFASYTLGPSSISFIWTSGGGTTAAFKLAYQTGGTAPANCNTGTIVTSSTLGVNPSAYTVNGLTSSTQYSFRLCALNSNESSASTGLTVTATTLANGQPVTVDLSTRQVVFMTTNTYRGIFGGIYFADFICQNEAADNGLAGIWKAVIGDESTSATSRLSVAGKVYNMRPLASGGIQQIAPNSAAFWGSSAAQQVYYNAGGTTPGSNIAWTGATAAGAVQTSNTCTNWTTNNSAVNGRYGTGNTTGNIISTNNTACNTLRSLYCTNQQSSASAPSNPSGLVAYATGATTIGLKWASGGGTTAGYKIAYRTGGTAPANCAANTVIPATTIGINPTSYSVQGLSSNQTYSFRLCAVNSDQSSVSSGVTVTASTLDSGLSATVDYSATQVVFTTANRYTGALGGLHFADWVCFQEAANSGISGTWKAVLSDETTAANTRLSFSGPIYNHRPLGSGGLQRIALDSTAFWTAIYEYPLSYTHAGSTPAVGQCWTGSTAAGGIQSGINCTSWTVGTAGGNGRYATNTVTANTQIMNTGTQTCNQQYHLYCINLQSAAAAPSNPGSFATGTIGTTSIQLTWASGGGTTAAYKIAYQTGGTAPANCATGTIIPSTTLGVNPTSYTVTGLSSGQQYSFRICALNSDESQVSSGSTVSGTTTSLTTPANQTVFSTSGTYNGYMGGVYFADYICQTEATAGGLAGVWKAILSDETPTNANARIALSATIWNNRPSGSGGPQQINTSGAFWSGAYTATQNYNASGGAVGNTNTWTGSTTAGALNTGLSCSSWTTNSASSNGRYGNNNATAVATLYNQGNLACSNSRSLYCISNQTASAAPSNPTNFSVIYKTSSAIGLTWQSGGGTTAAYKIAYQTGGTAPANCSAGTVISSSTLGINPTTYTVTGLSAAQQYSFRLCSTNSDGSSVSSGVTTQDTTQSLGSNTAYSLGSTQMVFVSTGTYRGSFGGIYFGDYICQSEAEVAGLPGTWKAVLSQTGTDASSRISLSGDIYNLRDAVSGGSQKITNSTNFWNHLFNNAVNYTANGVLSTTGFVWTGTTTAGVLDTNTCTDWTSQLAGGNGRYGTATSATSPYSTGTRACNNLTSVMCINQQTSSAAPSNPTGFATYATSATSAGFTWTSGGGTTAAYQIAYQTGGTAPGNCVSGTVIPAITLGVNPTTYTVTGLSASTTYSFRLCAFNSDRTAASAGVTTTLTTPASGSTLSLGSTQVVFGTERTYSGRIGGVYFADYACQLEADEVGLGGVWKAVVSTSGVNASSRISLSSLIYNTRSTNEGGIQQISDSTNFWAGPWSNAANYSVDGDAPGSTRGWTGTTTAGAVNGANHCSDFTTGSTASNGTHGNFATATNPVTAANVACNNLSSLYCINQQTAAAAPSDPTGFAALAAGTSFITLKWASGGGTTAAYKLAYQSGGTAPANCATGTVVTAATLGVAPTSYTVSSLSSNTTYSFRLCATNSDQSSVSTGVTATVATAASGTTFTVGTAQLLFATSNGYTGNFGGIYYGDFACQTEAEAAGLTGVWKAILSDGSNNASTRLSYSGTIYNLRLGASGGVQELTDGAVFLANSYLKNSAYYTASGGTPISANAWTGSTTAGVAGVHCTNWTTAAAAGTGATGTTNTTTAYVFSSNQACNTTRALWCLNQQSASAAPTDPASFTYTSVSSDSVTLNWTTGGGTTAGYKIAYQSGGTAPANCATGTVIGATTLGVNPSTYTVTGLSSATTYSFRLCSVNSDQSSVSAGQTLTVATTSGGTTSNLGSTQFIFGTTNTYYGNFGGIYFADYICQTEAETAGLTGVWKAVIGDETTASSTHTTFTGDIYNMRPSASGGPQKVIGGADFYTNSTLNVTFPYTASGTSPGSVSGWTGASALGAVSAGATCTNWTVGASGTNGAAGRNNGTTAFVNNGNLACNTLRGLLCTNQQSASSAPPDPTSLNAMATGSSYVTLNWASGGGTTAAYKLAYQSGGTAPANCNTGTVVAASTLGLNPTHYTITGLSSSTQYSFRLCALNSDSSSASSGATVTVTTTASGTTYNMGSNQFVFLTTATYYANFGNMNIGDYICQNEATDAGLTGIWRAILSDGSTNASSRISLTGKMYNLRPSGSGGIQRISDANSFWNLGSMAATFNYNASGTSPGTVNAWTGSTAAGAVNTTLHCSGWSSSTSLANGTTGRSDVLTTPLINQNIACGTARSLFCINQQSSAAAPTDATDFQADFRNTTSLSLSWTAAAGTTAAYKLAYQSGGTAPANCASGTVINPTTMVFNATNYTVTGLSSNTTYSFRLCAVNSDQTSVSTGVTLTTSTTSSGTTFAPGTNQYFFTTAATYTGGFGGLTFADFICQNEASAASMGGVWKAVLGDGTDAISTRLALSTNIYNTRTASSGGPQRLASGPWLLDGIMWNTQNYTAAGNTATAIRAWTGSGANGALNAAQTCTNWTSSLVGVSARYGTVNIINNTWLNSGGNATCNNSYALYCINQQTSPAAPADPGSFTNGAITTSSIVLNWTSGGGTTAGYKIAYQLGGTAPSNCTTGTVIAASTIGVNPLTYTVTGLSSATQYSFRICAVNSDQSSASAGLTRSVTTN